MKSCKKGLHLDIVSNAVGTPQHNILEKKIKD